MRTVGVEQVVGATTAGDGFHGCGQSVEVSLQSTKTVITTVARIDVKDNKALAGPYADVAVGMSFKLKCYDCSIDGCIVDAVTTRWVLAWCAPRAIWIVAGAASLGIDPVDW